MPAAPVFLRALQGERAESVNFLKKGSCEVSAWYNKKRNGGIGLNDTLAQLNHRRERIMAVTLLGYTLMVLGVLLLFSSVSFGILTGIVGGGLILAINLTEKPKYVRAYKNQIVLAVLREMFEDVHLNLDAGFNQEWVEDAHFIPTGNRFFSDDQISGSCRGCLFRRSDVLTQQVTHTGKTTTVTTLFEGPWMVFEFPKSFGHYLLVREKEFLSNGKPGGWFSGLKTERIAMESEEFNEKFEVYAEDEHEAFYLLSPQFMEKLEQAEREIAGRMYYGFFDHEFHVAVDNRQNSFEPPVFTPITPAQLEEIRTEARLVCELIDLLHLADREGGQRPKP